MDDIDLIPIAAEYTATGYELSEAELLRRFDQTGSSRYVRAARMQTMRAAIVATGTISLMESVLQQSLGWKAPFAALDAHLRAHGEGDLADRFLDYRDAINVLKHGAGRSHDRLLARREHISFSVRPVNQPFHDEGDVTEVGTLIRADGRFIRECAAVTKEVTAALRRTLPAATFG